MYIKERFQTLVQKQSTHDLYLNQIVISLQYISLKRTFFVITKKALRKSSFKFNL